MFSVLAYTDNQGGTYLLDRSFVLVQSGGVYAYDRTGGDQAQQIPNNAQITGTLMWMTDDPWPTALPGTAAV
jgi:hypothetical protein